MNNAIGCFGFGFADECYRGNTSGTSLKGGIERTCIVPPRENVFHNICKKVFQFNT